MLDLFSDPFLLMAGGGVALLAVLAYVLVSRGNRSGKTLIDQFGSRNTLMSQNEFEAMAYLKTLIGGSGHICPKVHVGDVLAVKPSQSPKADAMAHSRLLQNHVDFIVTAPDGRIQFAVEVDNGPPGNDQQKHEKALNAAFKQAGIPLIRVLPRKLERSDELEFAIQRLKKLFPDTSRAA